MNKIIADLHCHSTFFPFNEIRWTWWNRHRHYQMKRTVWHQHRHPCYPSQGDFTKLAKGGTRVLFLTLYPLEQGYLKANVLGLGTGDIADRLAYGLLYMLKTRADEIQDYDHSYFKDLLKEYKFIDDSPRSKKVRLSLFRTKKFKFRLVSNFNDLKNVLNLDDNFNYGSAADDTIAVIPTIEGGHSLGTGQKNTLTLNYSSLCQSIKTNIAILKNLGPVELNTIMRKIAKQKNQGFGDLKNISDNNDELKNTEPDEGTGLFCPFFISLCHFFWNQLGGHSVSLWDYKRKLFDQKAGINNGIEALGSLVVDELLSRSNGKRILIDVAHMSVNVREWFYHKYLPDREKETGEKIPVIVSHTGVNGWKDFSESKILGSPNLVHDYADCRYENSKIFNPWDVFISDEEILLIHDSGGLIGLSLDKRIMMGREKLRITKKKARFKYPYRKREIWIEPLIDEIIHIAETIYNKASNEDGAFDKNRIWDNICIGSDYDGMIKPIKAYPNATYFPKLDNMLFKGLLARRRTVIFLSGATDTEIREITDKIIVKNVLQFLKKHFN